MSTFGDEQAVWRAVHEIGAAKELDAGGFGKLRLWAGERARDLRATVFDKHKLGAMRPSFRDALGHAADAIKNGRDPE